MVRVSREIGGRKLELETGRIAKLADAAVIARYGDTMVLATAQAAPTEKDDIDFFPLTVDYREKSAAAGKFPGGFFKREGRPTTREILTARIIDRAIRPLFPSGFKKETQVLVQVLSTDRENDSDIVAAVAAFASVAISSIPHGKILGACRIGLIDGKLRINPTWTELRSKENDLNLTICAHADAIVMVEAGANQLEESVMLEALELGHEVCQEIAGMIDELVGLAGKPKAQFVPPARDEKLVAAIEKRFGKELMAAPVSEGDKHARSAAKSAIKQKVNEAFPAPAGDDKAAAKHKKLVASVIEELFDKGERESILAGRRADGRGTTDIRPLTIDVGVLPRVHGSSLFTRGETQALCIATLGTVDDQQTIDGIYPEEKRRWMLHYNFPPFSVGEVRRFGAPGRREIGHGALAERAIEIVLPKGDQFAYSLRVTSEITESNGSSSMATVCGATLALMDAGVPIKQPVAGIAMGLVVEGKRIAILSDILGSEDHCGDMDFKVAGTGRGITALQMDIKCEGLARATMQQALEQAKEGRMHILREMLKVIRRPRDTVSEHAPRLVSFPIPMDKIGAIIGPGGRTIRGMQEEFEVRIAVQDTGVIEVCGLNAAKVEACIARIKDMTAEVELGKVYKGRVTGLKEFGAFVEILPGQEGLVHVSELSDGFVRSVADVVAIGDTIEVKVIDIDDFGKVKLSRKALLAKNGDAPAEARREAPRGPARDNAGGGDELGFDAAPAEPRRRDDRRDDRRGPRPDSARPDRDRRGEARGFDRPERSESPDRPERSERPDRPERSERPDRPERSERFDRPERSERPDRPERSERPDRPERGERFDRPERSERPDRPERSERPDRPERSERPDRPERSERPDRPERSERPVRSERAEWSERPERGPRPERDERAPRAERPVREPRERGCDRDGDAPPSARRPEREERRPSREGDLPESPRGPVSFSDDDDAPLAERRGAETGRRPEPRGASREERGDAERGMRRSFDRGAGPDDGGSDRSRLRRRRR
ncbi:MAG: polyribonucleotide nucleotidyltransferase [Planctomycetes bacterium]|nr:polyribonucleotide nucleotidyltransferase [Planctomycetota bacterium]